MQVKDSRELVDSPFESLSAHERTVLPENSFRTMIAIERKRSERSGEQFLLMLVAAAPETHHDERSRLMDLAAAALLAASRETDLVGWYSDGAIMGALFTGLVPDNRELIRITLLSRLSSILQASLGEDEVDRIRISLHFFPDDWKVNGSGGESDRVLYPDLANRESRRKADLVLKRAIDVLGSLLILVLSLPLFAVIALAIKVASKGPVLFRQTRVGQYGRQFVLLKFRTMRAGSDPRIHREYVTRLIKNEAESDAAKKSGIYKLTNDARITRVGRFLRRSSLDELPQILNVLKGDMSLVGPRPPIPYELDAYETWHRRRLLEARPGVTGLWQVTSRSRVRFDEMVRLDLRYATSWSLWLDLKILLLTPLAVFRGAGAY